MHIRPRHTAGLTGVILAGGENRRFPTLKGLIETGGTTIIERDLFMLRDLFEDLIISANMPEVYFRFGVRLVGDALPSSGPMSGIFSCLLNAGGHGILAMACDMPFVKAEVLDLLCRRHFEAGGQADATVPVFHGAPQPLLAVYGVSALPALEQGLLSGKTAMRRLLEGLRTVYLQEEELRAVDPEGRSFVNINTPGDYEQAMSPALGS